MGNRSIDFFDTQFQRQIREAEFVLNPFEELALPYLQGRVLDLGCGLGNLTIAAARRGCSVLALDGSPHAVVRIKEVAAAEELPIDARPADLGRYRIAEDYDAIVAIGLLMFFERPVAEAVLRDIQAHVRPGGYAIINTLIAGTTYLDLFEPGRYCLFEREALTRAFAGWTICVDQERSFEAPGGTEKRFCTLVARR